MAARGRASGWGRPKPPRDPQRLRRALLVLLALLVGAIGAATLLLAALGTRFVS